MLKITQICKFSARTLALTALILVFPAFLSAQHTKHTLHDGGRPDTESVVMLILGDGYTAAQQATFLERAQCIADEIIRIEPFVSFERVNIYAVATISGDAVPSGFFGTTDALSIPHPDRLRSVRDALVPGTNTTMIISNISSQRGFGGEFPITGHHGPNRGPCWHPMIHELGHSFGGLIDERFVPQIAPREGINQTANNDPATARWRAWLGIPNEGNDGVIGFSEFDAGNAPGWFAPVHWRYCMMSGEATAFCRVCRAELVKRMAAITDEVYHGANLTDGNPSPLTTFTIPNNATRILEGAFHGASNLQEITIPASVISIGQYAFLRCTSLTTINMTSANPPTINETTFYGVNRAKITLNVPEGTAQLYKAAGWTDFNIFEEDNPISIASTGSATGNRYGIRFAINPVSEQAEISVVLPDASTASTGSATAATEISVVIYDMVGNVVFEEKATNRTPVCKVIWDLRNPAGRFVANGTYLVVVEAKNINGRIYRYSARLGVKR